MKPDILPNLQCLSVDIKRRRLDGYFKDVWIVILRNNLFSWSLISPPMLHELICVLIIYHCLCCCYWCVCVCMCVGARYVHGVYIWDRLYVEDRGHSVTIDFCSFLSPYVVLRNECSSTGLCHQWLFLLPISSIPWSFIIHIAQDALQTELNGLWKFPYRAHDMLEEPTSSTTFLNLTFIHKRSLLPVTAFVLYLSF